MKVFSLLSDKGGSGFYRVSEPARAAQAEGVDVSCDFNLAVEARRHPDGTHEVYEITQEMDVLQLQRPLPQIHHAIVVAARRQGIPVVIDLDDDFHNVHRQNVAIAATNRRVSPLENTRWLMKTLALATVITVSTPALLKYEVPGTKAVVVRNRMPERVLDLPESPRLGLLGWTGNVATHPQDLQTARGVLDQVDTQIGIVGYPMGVAEALQVPDERVRFMASWVEPVPNYWRALNGSMDVGIVPLESSVFNQSKSWLKGIEYAALGKPFIASPLPEYKRLVAESGAGVIAVSAKQWATRARELLEDGDGYRKAGLEWSRENVLERHVGDWITAWELALELST